MIQCLCPLTQQKKLTLNIYITEHRNVIQQKEVTALLGCAGLEVSLCFCPTVLMNVGSV